ncbi:MAG TPA: hypothetical protein DDX14_01070 [Cyanobacteria bacterium UBA9579]|nr:hypothetical protein [Cyanobacteria bacterium UBA9579]
MFRCTKCKSVDNFGLMMSPAYKGQGQYSEKFNEHGEIIINVDGYEFIPDLAFMNSHSVCKYCGEIKTWEYYFPRFHDEEQVNS